MQQLEAAQWKGKWEFETNLKYILHVDNAAENAIAQDRKPQCSTMGCSNQLQKLLRCKNCGMIYCSRDCQVLDWKQGHKGECSLFKKAHPSEQTSASGAPVEGQGEDELTKEEKQHIIEKQLRRVRIYLCPFVASKTSLLGPGFVFITSSSPIASWIGFKRRAVDGRMLSRSFKMEFLTLDDFDSSIADNFELGVIRPSISKLLQTYDKSKEVVCSILFACGYFTTATFNLVPDIDVSKRLGAMYEFDKLDAPLQLNIDEED